MKMTMHIDEDVLARVMKVTGAKSKTKAVAIALKEMARRHKLHELLSQGLGLTPDELRAEFADDYKRMMAEQAATAAAIRAAEKPPRYGKTRPRR